MKKIIFLIFLFSFPVVYGQDTLFWKFADSLQDGQVGMLKHQWGRESVRRVGTVTWMSPSGKELTLEIITCYRQIASANGFKDKSILALVKPGGHLVKSYDMVKKQNLPLEVRENNVVYKPAGTEILAALPAKLAERFCVEGMTCFNEIPDAHHVVE